MIHININDEQLLKIKSLWCSWFFRQSKINEFINILDKDDVFRNFFFENPKDYSLWKQNFINTPTIIKNTFWQAPILEFFFKDLSDINIIITKYKKDLQTNTKEFLLRNYNNYRVSTILPQIIDVLKLQVCPYCNRNFIESYSVSSQNGRKKTYFKGDLDHHYSKDEVPALMLSFYNLIPCCKVCNHEKLKSTLRPFYPYYNQEDIEYCFAIELYNETDKNDIIYERPIDNIESKRFDSTVWQGISDNFNIKLKSINSADLSECMKNSNILFRLEKKYNHSKDYVKELIRKKYIYPEVRKDELLRNFPDIFQKESDLFETFYSFSPNTKNFHNKPLSKLTKDILSQLDTRSLQ